MTENDIVRSLSAEGFGVERITQKVVEFLSRETRQTLYLERKIGMPQSAKLIVHPEQTTRYLAMLVGVTVAPTGEFAHHSNLLAFPTRQHGGQDRIRYGIPVVVESMDAVVAVAKTLLGRMPAASMRP